MRKFAGWYRRGGGHGFHACSAPETYGSVQVVYRGYIANRSALVEEAERHGEVLQEQADGRLFAAAFAWWGEQLQARVIGEYALAVVDTTAHSLLLTHDALGVLPVFYAERGTTVVFGSHLDALLEIVGTSELDESYLAEFLCAVKPGPDRTPYQDIRRLWGGWSLSSRRGPAVLRETWNLAGVEPVACPDNREYEERFRHLLRDGVRAALPSEGDVWSELSGGLDSSSVTCVAAEAGANKVKTLSLVFGRSHTGDERPWMRAVVEKYALPWYTLDIGATPPFSEFPTGFYAEPNPVMLVPGLYRRYDELMAAQRATVLLTGQGGDLALCGDSPQPFHLADLFLRCQWGRLIGGLREVQRAGPDERSLPFLMFRNVLRPALMYARKFDLEEGLDPGLPPYLHPQAVAKAAPGLRRRCRIPTRCRSVGDQYYWNRLWTGCSGAGTAGDQRVESFEFRSPLLYRPLVEFMFAIPWEQKIRPGQDRYLQRRALVGLLPEEVRLRRTKRGWEQAYFEGLRNSRPWLEMLTKKPRLVERGLVDTESWAEAVGQARFGRTHWMPLFLNACMLEVWLRQLERR